MADQLSMRDDISGRFMIAIESTAAELSTEQKRRMHTALMQVWDTSAPSDERTMPRVGGVMSSYEIPADEPKFTEDKTAELAKSFYQSFSGLQYNEEYCERQSEGMAKNILRAQAETQRLVQQQQQRQTPQEHTIGEPK